MVVPEAVQRCLKKNSDSGPATTVSTDSALHGASYGQARSSIQATAFPVHCNLRPLRRFPPLANKLA